MSETPETKEGCFPDPFCRCCECQQRHCLVPHPGHSHGESSDPLSMAVVLASLSVDARRVEELWRLVENLQDALHKVEWIRRAPDNQWACAFCGGVSIEHGGDDHREGCQWQHLIGVGPKDIAATIAGQSPEARELGGSDADLLRPDGRGT